MSSMMLALTEVKLFSPNLFPLLQMTPLIIPTVSLVAEKKFMVWCYWLLMIVHLIEQGQIVIPTGSMIKGSRPFYWILLKEANSHCFAIGSQLGIFCFRFSVPK